MVKGPATPADSTATDVLTAPAEDASITARFRLVVVDGPDQGAFVDLDAERDAPALLGASQVCALRLRDRMVSRRHASADVSDAGVRITDLGSTNGTYVRGLRIRDAFAQDGDIVTLGETRVRVTAMRADADRSASASTAHRFGRVVGASGAMRRLYATCERLAAATIPMVIEGETGTGKELLAEAIHEAGPRATGPFVVFDCTTHSASLLEAALFGHERGAFTGATSERAGVFEQAHGGTLLLDEIGELDGALQPKLLRAIESASVQRIGGTGWRKVDVRVIAATRRDLDREVAAGRFRDDLFYRLAVGRVALPPLRERRGDVTLLTHHFWRALGGEDRLVPPEVLARFEDSPWPGNVRELHNGVARYLAVGDVDMQEPSPSDGGDSVDRVLALDLPFSRARQLAADDFERRYVARVLARYGGNVARAALASGLARRYFQILRARSRSDA